MSRSSFDDIGDWLSQKARETKWTLRDGIGSVHDGFNRVLSDMFNKSADADTLAQYDIVTPITSYVRLPHSGEVLGQYVYVGQWETDNAGNKGPGIVGDIAYVSNEDLEHAEQNDNTNLVNDWDLKDSVVNAVQREALLYAKNIFPEQVQDAAPTYGPYASKPDTETVLNHILNDVLPTAEQTPDTLALTEKIQTALAIPAFRENLLKTLENSELADVPDNVKELKNRFDDINTSALIEADTHSVKALTMSGLGR